MDNFNLKKYLVENKVTRNSRMIKENSLDFTGLAANAAEEFLQAAENGIGPARFVKAMFKHYRNFYGNNLQDEGIFYEVDPEDEALLKAIGEQDLLA